MIEEIFALRGEMKLVLTPALSSEERENRRQRVGLVGALRFN